MPWCAVAAQDLQHAFDMSAFASTASIARFDNVSFGYESDAPVLSGINLDLDEGSFFYLTGLSGAGKTSLLSLLYLIHSPSGGALELFGADVSRANRNAKANIRRQIGVVFQDFRLLPHLTTFENVALPLRVAGGRETDIQENVRALLDWVGLSGFVDRTPEILSGGQQQLVAIARAVVTRPRLILADEPTGSVDDDVADRLMGLFLELHRQGTAMVIATHNEHLVQHYPNPRLHLSEGHLHAMAPGVTMV